jgi:hypothetical protein
MPAPARAAVCTLVEVALTAVFTVELTAMTVELTAVLVVALSPRAVASIMVCE